MSEEKPILFSEAKIGTTFVRDALVTSVSEACDKNGNPYCKITFADGDSTITANLFRVSKDELLEKNDIEEGVIAHASFAVSEYNGSKSFTVNNICYALQQDNLKDYIKVPPVEGSVMYDYIVNAVKNSHTFNSMSFLTAITLKLLEEHKYEFCTSSAAVAMHHNILGGLLYHTYRMVQAAESMSTVYPELDKELLVCGAALHDIGKIYEYNTTKLGEASVTDVGVIMGHLYMGSEMIHDTAARLGCKGDERVMLLQHMVLSHHGIQEWGAVMPPAIPEAFVLHYIDNIDAKVYTCFDVLQSVEGGSVTEKKPFGLDNRLYKRVQD